MANPCSFLNVLAPSDRLTVWNSLTKSHAGSSIACRLPVEAVKPAHEARVSKTQRTSCNWLSAMSSSGPIHASLTIDCGCLRLQESLQRRQLLSAAVLHPRRASTSTTLPCTVACKDHEAYQALPAKVAQWVLRLLDKNWQSYFARMRRLAGRPLEVPGTSQTAELQRQAAGAQSAGLHHSGAQRPRATART